jgi:hypothetical protein
MRTGQRLSALLFMCWAVLAQGAPGTTQTSSDKGSIGGAVRDASAGERLVQVALTLVGPSGRIDQATGDEGRFKFSDLKAGTYQLTAHGDFGEVLGTKSIPLRPGQEIADCDLTVLS